MWLKWLLNSQRIDIAIANGELISKADAVLILRKASSIHDQLISATWDDPAISGDDELHQSWIDVYKGIIYLVTFNDQSLITYRLAIEKLEYDVYTHQYWIDYLAKHPGFQMGYRGDLQHQIKWRDRWKAIIQFLKLEV